MEENRINSVGETADTIGGGENLETPHKRRVRYKGTHPRSYKEKYLPVGLRQTEENPPLSAAPVLHI